MNITSSSVFWCFNVLSQLIVAFYAPDRDFPEYVAYNTPNFFHSDWLNEVWPARLDVPPDDYRFVYLGPKGTWSVQFCMSVYIEQYTLSYRTPFHADVFR